MTLQTRQQIITIHILPNISRSKHNAGPKFGQLIKHRGETLFFKNHAENEVGRLVPEHFSNFKKTLCNVQASGWHLSFKIFW